MKVHIVGAGPTGITIAWELSKLSDIDVYLYDKKSSVGGSWWEPSKNNRNLHSHRALFDSFVNTKQLLKEMNIRWKDVFGKLDVKDNSSKQILTQLNFNDKLQLLSRFVSYQFNEDRFKLITVKDEMSKCLSNKGKQLLSTLTYIFDGIPWDVMTMYEFIKTVDYIGLNPIPDTQIKSGWNMNMRMQQCLIKKGVKCNFNHTLIDIDYSEPYKFTATFDNPEGIHIISDDMLILCVDHLNAIDMIKSNWKLNTKDILFKSAYTCLNVLLYYDDLNFNNNIETIKIAMDTPWNIIVGILDDHKTVSCVMCNMNNKSDCTNLKVSETPPGDLEKEVVRQLGFPVPKNTKICWGSTWTGGKWIHEQSSGVITVDGTIPYFGKNHRVAMCGMMSERNVPFSSIEASVEIGKTFVKKYFNKSIRIKKPWLISNVISKFFFLSIMIIMLPIVKKTLYNNNE